MYALMIYSLKVGACLAVFYLFFKLLLSRETFHRFNRFLVLGAMVLAFVLPLCVITVYREVPLPAEDPVYPEILEENTVTVDDPLPEPFPWERAAGGVFLAGALAALLGTCRSLFGVMRLVRQGRRERLEDGAVLVRTERAVTPFSWGRYIVMSGKDLAENGEAILLHERAHLRLRHSLDLIVTDLAGCLQWFNPAMWLLRRELRAIHEYEADEAVLETGVDARSYQMLLIRKAVGGRWYSVANSFNHSKLKNRITMMLRKKSSRWAGARALLLIPLTGAALGAFAETAYLFPEDKVNKENVTVHVSGSDFSVRGVKGRPLILVDGREVRSLDSIRSERIESITVLKDSTSAAAYGDRGKDGVMLVTLKPAGEAVSGGSGAESAGEIRVIGVGSAPKEGIVVTSEGPGERKIEIRGAEGRTVRILGADSGSVADGPAWKIDTVITKGTPQEVRVIGYGTKAGKPELKISRRGSPLFLVDGVRVSGIESLDHNEIQSITVLKKESIPEEYIAQGYTDVIKITTKDAYKARKADLKTVEEAFKADAAGIESARRGLEQARKFMSSEAWKEAQQALDKAAEMRREAAAQIAEAQKAAEAISGNPVRAARVEIQNSPESSVSVYKGRVTFRGELSKEMLYFINGRPAPLSKVMQLAPGKIRRMTVYKGDEAVKRWGERGRRGVVDIRARK